MNYLYSWLVHNYTFNNLPLETVLDIALCGRVITRTDISAHQRLNLFLFLGGEFNWSLLFNGALKDEGEEILFLIEKSIQEMKEEEDWINMVRSAIDDTLHYHAFMSCREGDIIMRPLALSEKLQAYTTVQYREVSSFYNFPCFYVSEGPNEALLKVAWNGERGRLDSQHLLSGDFGPLEEKIADIIHEWNLDQ